MKLKQLKNLWLRRKTSIDQDALRAKPNMADWRRSWGTFKKEVKANRRKTGDSGGKKNEKCNILERQELVVQKLQGTLEVSRKAQKYTRVRPSEFVQYDVEELSIEGIINVQTTMHQDVLVIHCQI